MLEFGFRAGMLGFATSSAESFVFRTYWFIFWQILERGQWWVSLAVSSPLPLLDSFVDQESFQGTGELRFSWNIWPIIPASFKFISLRPRSIFYKTNTVEWWITVVQVEMCWCSWQSIPVLNLIIMCGQRHHCLQLLHPTKTHTCFDLQRQKWWMMIYIYSTFMCFV